MVVVLEFTHNQRSIISSKSAEFIIMEFSPFIDLRNESDHSNELCDYNQVEGKS
jgi:hypothetical protein